LGIGANIVAFSLVDAVLLRPLPFGSRSERVVTLHSIFGQQVRALGDVSYPDLVDVRGRVGSFDGVAGLLRVNFTVSTHSEADRLMGYYVTPELFRMLGVAPMSGRQFSFEDAAPPGLETTVMVDLNEAGWAIGHAAFGFDRLQAFVFVPHRNADK
jgi:putative ABC transport system permease protein